MYKQLPLNELLEKLEVFVTYNISNKSGGMWVDNTTVYL